MVRGVACLALSPCWFIGQAMAAGLHILLAPAPPLIGEGAGPIPRGPGVALLREIGARAGVDVDFRLYPPARAQKLAEVQAGSCSPMARFPERAAHYKWSAPVVAMRLVLLAAAEDKRRFASLEQARGLKIGAVRGSAVASRMQQLGWPLDEVADNGAGLKMLQLRRFDLLASLDAGWRSRATALGIAKPRVALVVEQADIFLGCSLKTDDALIARMSAAIEVMRRDGSLRRFDLS